MSVQRDRTGGERLFRETEQELSIQRDRTVSAQCLFRGTEQELSVQSAGR